MVFLNGNFRTSIAIHIFSNENESFYPGNECVPLYFLHIKAKHLKEIQVAIQNVFCPFHLQRKFYISPIVMYILIKKTISRLGKVDILVTVSYTHLTLPTNREV